jgi:hypothetical protein
MVPRSCCLVFISNLGVGFYSGLGGEAEAFFCFLRADSRVGAGLDDGRLVFLPLLPFGVEKLEIPFDGLLVQVIGIAGDSRFVCWAAMACGVEGGHARSFLPLCALTSKLPLLFQSFRCALVVDSRRWLMRLYKVWASSFKLGGGFVFLAGMLVNDSGSSSELLVSVWPLFSCAVISIHSRDLVV